MLPFCNFSQFVFRTVPDQLRGFEDDVSLANDQTRSASSEPNCLGLPPTLSAPKVCRHTALVSVSSYENKWRQRLGNATEKKKYLNLDKGESYIRIGQRIWISAVSVRVLLLEWKNNLPDQCYALKCFPQPHFVS